MSCEDKQIGDQIKATEIIKLHLVELNSMRSHHWTLRAVGWLPQCLSGVIRTPGPFPETETSFIRRQVSVIMFRSHCR